MKKLFMFLAVAGLATFGTACSSSDDNTPPPPPEVGQLALSASKTTLEINEKVTFAVKLDGKAVADAEIFIDGTKISGYETSFATAKAYKVVAKKAGSKDSSELTITVKEKVIEKKQLVLTATPVLLALNAETTFKVTLDGQDVTSSSVITVNGTAVTNAKFKSATAGDFTAIAKKEGSIDSEEVVVTVLPAATAGNKTVYGGTEKVINNTVFGIRGFYYIDETETTVGTLWLIQTTGPSNFITQIAVMGPAIEDAEGYLPADPTLANTVFNFMIVVDGGTAVTDETVATTTGTAGFALNALVSDPNKLFDVTLKSNLAGLKSGKTFVHEFTGTAGLVTWQTSANRQSATATSKSIKEQGSNKIGSYSELKKVLKSLNR